MASTEAPPEPQDTEMTTTVPQTQPPPPPPPAAPATAAAAAPPTPAPAPASASASVQAPDPQNTKQSYKSYRKKFRKMHMKFARAMDEAHSLYIAEEKAAEVALRIQEENDKLMELLLEINGSVHVPAKMRFELDSPDFRGSSALPSLEGGATGSATGTVPGGGKSLEFLRGKAVHTEPELGSAETWPEELKDPYWAHAPHSTHLPSTVNGTTTTTSKTEGRALPGYLTTDHEQTYLATLDKSLALVPDHEPIPAESEVKAAPVVENGTTKADIKRANALSLLDFGAQYPHSAHNWLKLHAPRDGHHADDASQRGKSPPPRKGKGGKGRGGAHAAEGARVKEERDVDPLDEELGVEPDVPAKGKRKRLADGEDAYRPKGGSGGKKRKRASDAGEGTLKKKRGGEED